MTGPEAALEAAAADAEVLLPAGAAARVTAFFGLLLTWNARINLTGARSLEELVEEHFPDSLALARLVPAGARLVDVGAGGGLPALPFALLRPDAPVTLVEPRAKRVAFLRTAAREFGLGQVTVRPARLEALRPGEFDVAVSRATFPPAEWLARGAPLVRPGGCIIVLGTDPVAAPEGLALRFELRYRGGQGRPRWAGAYCST